MTYFLVQSLAADGVADIDDPGLDERHWAYTDPHAATMIARGPMLDPTRSEWTGSIHILELADQDAVRRYLEDEPYHRAGAYREHRIWRFDDALGRTMRDTVRVADELRFFVLIENDEDTRSAAQLAGELRSELAAQLVVLGDLADPTTGADRGIACAAQVPTRADIDTLIRSLIGPSVTKAHLEVIDWEFGGRR